MSVRVEFATLKDFPWILEQLEIQDEWYCDSHGSKRRFFVDKEHMSWTLNSLLESGILLIARVGDERVGYIAGWVSPHPYNPEIKVATHASWWVSQDRRHTKAAIQLLLVFKSTAQALGCDKIIISLAPETPIREESMMRWGFIPSDRCYVMEV
jgi:hypothetical protein